GVLPGQVQFRFIHVHADRVSLGADGSGKLQGDVSAATAEVEAVHSRCETRLRPQTRCGGPHHARQHLETFLPFNATANNVGARCCHCCLPPPPNAQHQPAHLCRSTKATKSFEFAYRARLHAFVRLRSFSETVLES